MTNESHFSRNCPACASTAEGATGVTGIVACRDCGFWFADPAPGQPEIDTAAAALPAPPMPSLLINVVPELIYPWLDRDRRIAVAGRSPGRLVATLRRYYPRVNAYEGCSAVLHLYQPGGHQFGLLVLQQSLEYLRDPARAFDQADAALIDGGYLCIQVPIPAPALGPSQVPAAAALGATAPALPTHGAVNFFSRPTLAGLAARHGFEFCAGRHSDPDSDLAVTILTNLFERHGAPKGPPRRAV